MSRTRSIRSSMRRRERGVVLLFCLVVLVVLLAGGVAVMRSMNASLATAGNLAFRRDLVNKGEQATARVLAQFRSGGVLQTPASEAADLTSANYSASRLETNAQGIPTILLQDDTAFGAKGAVSNDIKDADESVKVRYIIDRLCNAAGLPSTLGPTGCVYAPSTTQVTGGSSQRARDDLPPPSSIVYRLSIRVSGPRDTQVFLQSSFTKPEL